MNTRIMHLCVAAVLFANLGFAMAYENRKAWLTIGDASFQHAKKVSSDIVSIDSVHVKTAGAKEKIHVVLVKEAEIPTIAGAIHGQLGHCGGFMYHATEAEAHAALRRQRAPVANPGYTIDNQDLVVPMLAQMQETNVAATIIALSEFTNRYYNSQAGVDASNWLMQKWTDISKDRTDISVRQFSHAGFRQQSVILTIAGTDNAAEAIVIGAHLDSILSFNMTKTARAPGADDDASGVASMTEALRAMIAQGFKPRRTIHMIAYAGEEVGLRGSQEIARSFKQNNTNVVGVLQLDMTNYKGAANDIYLFTDYTDSKQNEFVAQLISVYLPELKVGYDKCGYGCSDHVSWDAQGYPTSMPFESTLARHNPRIHSTRDTFANSGNQAAHALKFARLTAAFAVELGSD